MNENIDLIKILKDCPKGFKLYSTIHGPVTFVTLDLEEYQRFQIIVQVVQNKTTISFTKEGKYFTQYVNAECCLFPSKDQRDWNKFSAPWYKNSKFNAHCKFKDGDIIQLGTVTAIFKKYIGEEKCICYCSFYKDGGFEIPIENGEDNVYGCYSATPATKEQCDTLMKAMNDVGYEWDAEKKELKKFVPNKFDPKTLKPFDKILVRRSNENHDVWFPDFVSDPPDDTSNKTLCMCIMEDILMVIPYNDDTKHLAGTSEEAPKFYRHWED